MKKWLLLFLLLSILGGCASYKFKRGQAPYDKGYVASRDDYTILEYTVGSNNTVPSLALARDRFSRRRGTVEDYYKKMGYIENRFKMVFVDPCIFALKLIGGIFRMPFVAIADYKYEHNPEYRQKIKKMEEERDLKEEGRLQKLKEELHAYITEELAKEKPAE